MNSQEAIHVWRLSWDEKTQLTQELYFRKLRNKRKFTKHLTNDECTHARGSVFEKFNVDKGSLAEKKRKRGAFKIAFKFLLFLWVIISRWSGPRQGESKDLKKSRAKTSPECRSWKALARDMDRRTLWKECTVTGYSQSSGSGRGKYEKNPSCIHLQISGSRNDRVNE